MDVEQRRIGLTGGIATGKSTVSSLLKDRFGLPILDADCFAREALAPGSPATEAVIHRYGKRVLAPDAPLGECVSTPDQSNSLDRRALGHLVFSDPEERRWLENLVHPLVRRRFEQELAAMTEAPAVVLVIPLLFEAGLEGMCSEIWLVDCDAAEQQARLMGRDGSTAADADARIAAQWPLERKRARADALIDNRAGAESLISQLERALGWEARSQEC
jgi:dephospho-CoA kinase